MTRDNKRWPEDDSYYRLISKVSIRGKNNPNDPNRRVFDNNTMNALHWTSKNGCGIELYNKIVLNICKVNEPDKNGYTALMYVCQRPQFCKEFKYHKNAYKMLQRLLEHPEIDINKSNRSKMTAFKFALQHFGGLSRDKNWSTDSNKMGTYIMTDLLSRKEFEFTVDLLDVAITYGCQEEVFSTIFSKLNESWQKKNDGTLLIKLAGVNIRMGDKNYITSAEINANMMIKTMLKVINPNTFNKDGESALIKAVLNNNTGFVRQLLDSTDSVDINMVYEGNQAKYKGMNALQIALNKNSDALQYIVIYVAKHGGCANTKTSMQKIKF